MTLTEEEVLRILRLIDSIEFGELRLEFQDMKLHFTKVRPSESRAAAMSPGSSESPNSGEPVSQHLSCPDRSWTAASQRKVHIVTAPISGQFYRAPQPGAPVFVDVGQPVLADDTVGLVEVMKLFQSISAGRDGMITKVLAEDGAEVSEGQPLFAITER